MPSRCRRKLFFAPTFEFHWQVWVEKGVLALPDQQRGDLGRHRGDFGLDRNDGGVWAVAAARPAPRAGVLFALLSMRMFPHILLAIPFFVLAESLGLINTYPAMILALVAINQPFTIWLMRSFFLDVPHELYEAAEIDGCNAWQVFSRVALPVVRPGLWVTALFSLLLAYNEFLFALVLTGPDTKTLPVAIAEYGGGGHQLLVAVGRRRGRHHAADRRVHDGAATPSGARPGVGRGERLSYAGVGASRMQQPGRLQVRPQRRRNALGEQRQVGVELRRRRAGPE